MSLARLAQHAWRGRRPAAAHLSPVRVSVAAADADGTAFEKFCVAAVLHALGDSGATPASSTLLDLPAAERLVLSRFGDVDAAGRLRGVVVPDFGRLSGENTHLELVRHHDSEEPSTFYPAEECNAHILLVGVGANSRRSASWRDNLEARLSALERPTTLAAVPEDTGAGSSAPMLASTAAKYSSIVYSFRFCNPTDAASAHAACWASQHSVLYPSTRLRGPRLLEACKIVHSACWGGRGGDNGGNGGAGGWHTFDRVVWGRPREDVTMRPPSAQIASPQDLAEWMTALRKSGNAMAAWGMLRAFGFDGQLVKRRHAFHKAHIPHRLVK